jgi:hypothetical protein
MIVSRRSNDSIGRAWVAFFTGAIPAIAVDQTNIRASISGGRRKIAETL